MINKPRPHLLHVALDVTMNNGVAFRIECPYTGVDRPCAVLDECCHKAPEEPELPEPRVKRWHNNEPEFEGNSDERAVDMWTQFYRSMNFYAEFHDEVNGWHRTDECWVDQYMKAGGYEDTWEFADGFHQAVDGPVPVLWGNRGSVDDSYLVLYAVGDSRGC